MATPHVIGTTYAFYLVENGGSWPPEIDITENATVQSGSTVAAQTLWNGTSATEAGQCLSYNTVPNLDTAQFHTYGVDWTASTVTFYIDRVATCSFPTPAGYNVPLFPILAAQTGGDWVGSIPAGTQIPPMQVDYVRVWSTRPF